jgi:hypothetical protein
MNGGAGMYFYIINKQLGPDRLVPVYKSEIQALGAGDIVFNK